MDREQDSRGTVAATPRRPQWIYLVPVLGAPVAHIFVSATRIFPRRKRLLLWLVAASTTTAIANRLWLMSDAGFPGAEGPKDGDRYEQRHATTPTPSCDDRH